MGKKVERYSDIIDLPHHQSVRRPHMTSYNRAAQFAPFAALVGYEQMVQDTADILLLDKRVILSEDLKASLDENFRMLKEQITLKPAVQVLYFDKTANELGGAYVSYSGILRRIEEHPARMIMMDRKEIYIEDILDMNIVKCSECKKLL